MKRTIAITALITGILLVVVPRYVLPACEFAGYSRMHCSDTAEAVRIVGAALVLVGVAVFFLRRQWMLASAAVCSLALYAAAMWMPARFGYCQSTRMPCNYGMVPAIRFLSIAGIAIMTGALVGMVYIHRKKGNS